MASSRLLLALAVAVVAGCAVGLSGATDHIVGANRGWNPNINYTLWSGNHTFFVGDLICKLSLEFHHSSTAQKGTHNVFEVNETGYDNCTMDGVAGNWTSGKDFIPLKERRRYFFICGNGLCQAGMKVAVTVRRLPHEFEGTQMVPASAAATSFTASWLTVTALAAVIAAVA